MKKTHLIAGLLLSMAVSSCSERFYGPALYQNDVQQMIKPHSKDSVKTRLYGSGTLLMHDNMFNQTDDTKAGLLNIYRSHTVPHFNFSYGVLGFAGTYKEQVSAKPAVSNKAFTGFGFNGSASYYVSTKKTDWRLIGVDMVYTQEGGDYLAYRRAVANQPDVYSATQAGMFSYGIFSEMLIRLNKDVNIGAKLFINKTTGQLVKKDTYNYYGASTSGATISLGYKMLTGYLTSATSSNLSGGSVQVGLACRF
ncbi:hypothetical protein FFF34_008245 [Inquilinus sp. KBS0705]|nr:hypothetical protein FFF34_008245 [Inquilinus sp. KBS0705]